MCSMNTDVRRFHHYVVTLHSAQVVMQSGGNALAVKGPLIFAVHMCVGCGGWYVGTCTAAETLHMQIVTMTLYPVLWPGIKLNQ